MSLTMSSEIDYVFTNIDQRVFKFPKTLHYFVPNAGGVWAIFPTRLFPPCFSFRLGPPLRCTL